MAFEIREKVSNREITVEVLNLQTICPHKNEKDVTELKLTYKPGGNVGRRYIIDRDNLAKFIRDNIQSQPILMEMIPIKILEYCVQSTAGRVASRYASPEWIKITATSRGKVKKFTMDTQVTFQREVK